MATKAPHTIRRGTEFANQKLYEFSNEGIIVMSQWPDMRAWRRTPKGQKWMQIRPYLHVEFHNNLWTCDVGRRESKVKMAIDGVSIQQRIINDLVDQPEGAEREHLEAENQVDEAMPGTPDQPFNIGSYTPAWVLATRAEYLKSIPEEVLVTVSAFSSRHWHLLNLISRCPGAMDLVKSTPALAFALASLWVFRENPPKQPLRAARSLLRKPQSDIAAWLGFPKSKSAIQILRKIKPADCTIPNLLQLRNLYFCFSKSLCHMQQITSHALYIMAHSRLDYSLSSSYVYQLGLNPSPGWLESEPRLIRDVLWLRDTLGEQEECTIHSHQNLQKQHDQLVERVGRMDLRRIINNELPDPPFGPSITAEVHIEPITTAIDLIKEGKAQKNCVGAYADRVRRGGLYVYRVLAPERATLSIAQQWDRSWVIDEIKAKDNSDVQESTIQHVKKWLSQQYNAESCQNGMRHG
jgi:hypothetical protein